MNRQKQRILAIFLVFTMVFINIFSSISIVNVFAKEKNINELLESEINECKNNLTKNGKSTFLDPSTIAFGLRRAGVIPCDIEKNYDIYTNGDFYNFTRNIIGIIASGNNPRNYKNIDYVSKTLKEIKDIYDCEKPERLVKAILALDMAEAKYDQETAIRKLINMLNDEGGKLVLGVTEEEDDGFGESEEVFKPNVEATALSLVVLANHREISGVEKAIQGIKRYFKDNQNKKTGFIQDFCFGDHEDSTVVTSKLIQGLVALGENPLKSTEWNINGKNLLEILLSAKAEKGFKANSKASGDGAEINTKEVLIALTDLKEDNSGYLTLKYTSKLEPFKIELGDILKEITVGDSFQVEPKVFNKDNLFIKDEEIGWEISNDDIVHLGNGKFQSKKVGTTNVKVYVKSNKDISATFTININKNCGLNEKQKEIINKEIEILKKHFEAYGSYEFLASPAANIANVDKKIIENKIYEYQSLESVFNLSRSIIALIGADLNPRNFKGVNCVDELIKYQMSIGDSKGQFINTYSSDKDRADILSYCILALDMAGAKYDNESAVKALVKLVNNEEYKKVIGYEEARVEGIILTALANYKDVDGVKDAINKLITFLKQKQNEDGGFNLGNGYFKNNPVATSSVIQGLILNGINPLTSTEWIKNNKTMLDSLMMSKYSGDDKPINWGFSKSDEKLGLDYKSTYYVFAALTDLVENESMFNRLKKDTPTINLGKASDIKINSIQKDKLLIGDQLALKANVYDKNKNLLINSNIVWESSDNSKATVQDGLVKVLGAGTVNIIAKVNTSSEEIKDSIQLNLFKNEVKKINIIPEKSRLRVGEKVSVTSEVINTLDEVQSGKVVNWKSSNEKVVKVYNEKNEIEGIAPGKAEIIAIVDGEKVRQAIEIVVVDQHSCDINVRIEGLNKTLYDEVLNYNFDTETTPLEILRQAVGEKNIEGKKQLGMGYFITSILGETQKPEAGWCYYVVRNNGNIESPTVGVDAFKHMSNDKGICDITELVFYMSTYTDEDVLTVIPKIKIEQKENKFIFQVKNALKNKAIEGVTFAVDGLGKFKTDKEGKVIIDLDKKQEYLIKIFKGNDNPEVVRQTLKVTSPGKEKTNEELKSKVVVKNINKVTKVENNKEIKNVIQVSNHKEQEQEVTVIEVLYDENGKFIKLDKVSKILERNEKGELETKLNIPSKGKYTVKVFVWDNIEQLTELCDTIQYK